MTVEEIIASMEQLDIRLRESKGELMIDGPKEVLTSERLALLREHKWGIVAQLQATSKPKPRAYRTYRLGDGRVIEVTKDDFEQVAAIVRFFVKLEIKGTPPGLIRTSKTF